MSLKKYIYIKKQQLSRFLALALARRHAFTALILLIKTLRAHKYLPEKIIALEVFSFIGTSTVMDYSGLADYVEMWEIDPYYARWAKKLNPKANVICGDSIDALKNGKVKRRDYNFVVIDSNIFTGHYYESFGVFSNVFQYLDKKSILIVTIYNDIEELANIYKIKVSDFDSRWLAARKEFFKMENIINAPGKDYLSAFSEIINHNGYKLIDSSFLSRNDAVGFGVFVIQKNE